MGEWKHDTAFRERMSDVRASQHVRIKSHLLESGLEDEELASTIGLRLSHFAAIQAMEMTESPIEALFLVGLTVHTVTIGDLAVRPQCPVGQYRVDVALRRVWDVEHPLYVELDGHDYHERTKEQAEHDRKRDRWFSSQGLRVVRFTGREVWRDPEACADEAIANYLDDLDRRGELNGGPF